MVEKTKYDVKYIRTLSIFDFFDLIETVNKHERSKSNK